jgi:hypothetical protein
VPMVGALPDCVRVTEVVFPLVTVAVSLTDPVLTVYVPIGIQLLEYAPEALVVPLNEVAISPPLRFTGAALTAAPTELTTVTLMMPAVANWKFSVDVPPFTLTVLLSGR